MPVTFSQDELFLLEQLSKKPEEIQDIDRVAELLVKSMGDMKFNKKIRLAHPELAKFIYKTQDYQAISSINRKVQINKNLAEQGLEITEEEKLSLKEIGRLIKFADLSTKDYNTNFNKKLKFISRKCTNKDFKNLYDNISQSQSELRYISRNIKKSSMYQTNDFSIVNIDKEIIQNNLSPALTDRYGTITKTFISAHGHAAPLYIKNSSKGTTRPRILQSHLDSRYEIKPIDITDILSNDILRIDPTKLVNKNFIQKLQEVYGTNWEAQLQTTYENIANSLHKTLELKITEYKKLRSDIKSLKIEKQIFSQNKKKSLLQEVQKQIKEKNNKVKFLRKTRIQLNEKSLNRDKWVSPKAIIQGHTKLGHKNDFRKISNEMFNPTEENKKMICSEFGAVTIASTIDQLNRIVALDLQAAGLITSEQEIFKNPIPKNERLDKIHPGRLVHLLKKAGAVEVRNETVDQYVKKHDLTSMNTANIERDLPNKILFLLKNSKNEQEFSEKAQQNLAIYLEAYQIEKEIISQVQKDAKKEFADLYKRKHETGIITTIKKFCKGLVVFCGLREKEKGTKLLTNKLVSHADAIKLERQRKKVIDEFYSKPTLDSKSSRTR